MKLVSIFAAMPGCCGGLLDIKRIVNDTFSELGVDLDEVNLAFSTLPFYDGMKSEVMSDIAALIRKADGLVIYFHSSFGLPGAMAQSFIEHLNFRDYDGLIKGKNCFLLGFGADNTLMDAANILSTALFRAGAFTGEKLLADEFFCEGLKKGDGFAKLVERQTEDFFRLVRQKRMLYVPGSKVNLKAYQQESFNPESLLSEMLPANNNTENLSQKDIGGGFVPLEPVKIEPLPVKPSETDMLPEQESSSAVDMPSKEELQSAVERFLKLSEEPNANLYETPVDADDDLNEIAGLFKKKLSVKARNSPVKEKKEQTVKSPVPIVNKQAEKPKLIVNTAAITRYYQPGQAEGLKAVIMLNITGSEGFDGYLELNGRNCEFYEGIFESPDVTIVSQPDIWSDIIKGKVSAQKAFMIGQIKVRGNFILLTKFDQIFDLKKGNIVI